MALVNYTNNDIFVGGVKTYLNASGFQQRVEQKGPSLPDTQASTVSAVLELGFPSACSAGSPGALCCAPPLFLISRVDLVPTAMKSEVLLVASYSSVFYFVVPLVLPLLTYSIAAILRLYFCRAGS